MLCGGGTGGHIYPILAVLEALKMGADTAVEILYLGSEGGLEREIVSREGIPFRAVSTASVVGTPAWKLPTQGLRILQGTLQARQIIRSFRPQVILATGGFVSVPPILAAWLEGVPRLLYLPDIAPGLAVRFLSPFVQRIAVSFPESLSYFSERKTVFTGYPVRQGIGKLEKSAARHALGLDEEGKVLLILGGSRGAHAINLAISQALPALLKGWQVIHISGHADFTWLGGIKEALPPALRESYHLFTYLYQEFPAALAAADLAIARAGASVLGEFPAAGLPSILIPYPYAQRHQEGNARYLADRGASIVLDEKEIEKLPYIVSGLSQDDARLQSMAERARRLVQPQAAQKLAEVLRKMIQEGAES